MKSRNASACLRPNASSAVDGATPNARYSQNPLASSPSSSQSRLSHLTNGTCQLYPPSTMPLILKVGLRSGSGSPSLHTPQYKGHSSSIGISPNGDSNLPP